MAVNLSRPNDPAKAQETLAALSVYVAARVFDNYCSVDQYRAFVEHGVTSTGQDMATVEHAVDLELERMGAANELRLLAELDGALHRFTASDRKLDSKEKGDAMQLVCKSRPGFCSGLRVDVAEAAILAYCRAHNVKQKVGFFSWAVP
jgi:hypothetical protein